jgi:hypothetical protein
MANDLARAEFWRAFILERSGYPAPVRLEAQFDDAVFSDFCPCGCNSFSVSRPADSTAPSLVSPSDRTERFVFEADFPFLAGGSLEILLFAGADGRLCYVEIDYNANSEPVPDEIEVGSPYRTHTPGSPLLGDD